MTNQTVIHLKIEDASTAGLRRFRDRVENSLRKATEAHKTFAEESIAAESPLKADRRSGERAGG